MNDPKVMSALVTVNDQIQQVTSQLELMRLEHAMSAAQIDDARPVKLMSSNQLSTILLYESMLWNLEADRAHLLRILHG
jgi:hypothetical protein